MLAWPTPHEPFTPAPVDSLDFPGIQAPRTPNWNTTDEQNAQKHWFVRTLPALTEDQANNIDQIHQLRQQSLQAIDRYVQKLVDALIVTGELNNTVIIYESDNGYQLGQHRKSSGKRLPYEHDIRVTWLWTGSIQECDD